MISPRPGSTVDDLTGLIDNVSALVGPVRVRGGLYEDLNYGQR